MRRAVLISLAGHLLALASFALGLSRTGPPPPPPSKIHTVDLVGDPAVPRNRKPQGQTKPSQAVPKTETVKTKLRSGQQVDTAPSTEAMSPKGTKKPARTAKQQPKPEVQRGGGAQAKGKEGMTTDEVFEYEDYLADMKARIAEAWRQPLVGGQTEVLKTTIFFTILKDGKIDESMVEFASGVNGFDRSALEAVQEVDPLPSLPEGFKGNQLGVHLDFAEK